MTRKQHRVSGALNGTDMVKSWFTLVGNIVSDNSDMCGIIM